MNKQKGLSPILIVLLIALAVGGYLLYQKQTKPVTSQPVTQSSPTPVTAQTASSSAETVNPDSIGANWKTYTNEIGYSLKYPQDWDIIRIPDSPGIIIAPQKVINSLKAVIKTSGEIGSIDQEINKLKIVVVVPDSGINSPKTSTDIVFENKNKPNMPIRITLFNSDYQNIYDQLISTFKFTQ